MFINEHTFLEHKHCEAELIYRRNKMALLAGKCSYNKGLAYEN